MKTFMTQPLIASLTLALCFAARAQQDNPPAADGGSGGAAVNAPQSETDTSTDTTAEQQQAVGQLIQAVVDAAQPTNGEQPAEDENSKPAEPGAKRPVRGQGTRGTTGTGTNAVSLSALVASQSTNHTAGTAQMLRLNFRNAPLSMVLDYLSDAAGFTISANSKVDLKGAVTVWSNRPVTRNEAIQILDDSLTASGYAATVEGNVLNIFVVDATNTKIIAGIPNNDYTNIPPTKDLVTQIVYVHNVEATQLITSLQPLMPTGTSMTANQGANAIVITDSKANIRRMAQLVKALDTPNVSASTVRVFPLTYADATALAQVVTQLFQGESAGSRSGTPSFGFFPGGFPGRGSSRSESSSSSAAQTGRVAAAKVTAVADDRSNSLVVSGSDEQMALVEELVKQMDVNVDDLTEVRVFRLLYADPQEIADQLTSLFPDPTTRQTTSSRTSSQPGGPFPFFTRDRSSSGTSTDPNSRKFTQARVTAVPDPRTGSVIVSASHDLMSQIAGIIEKLDSDPARKKKVYVIKVENRDPQDVVEELQSVIATDSSGNLNNARSTSQQSGSQLNTRQQNNLRNQGNSSSSLMNGGASGTRTGR
jgi:type II secretory pathway component GspD/PulD (secretin)